MEVSRLCIHHSGGLGTNNNASSRFLTFGNINTYHKNKWNFPSKYIKGQYGGYNAGYDPKSRKFHQWRAVGEETAAQRGFNTGVFSFCMIGNLNKARIGTPLRAVDPLTRENLDDIFLYLYDLVVLGNKRSLVMAPGASISFTKTDVFSHRYFNRATDCYGTFYSDNYFRDELIKYKVEDFVSREGDFVKLRKENAFLIQLIYRLLAFINDNKLKGEAAKMDEEGLLSAEQAFDDGNNIEVEFLEESLRNKLKAGKTL